MRVPNGFPEVPSLLRGSGAAPVVNLNFRPGLSGRDVRGGRVPGLRLDHRPGWMRGDPRWTAGIVHPAGYTDSLNTERISYINRARDIHPNLLVYGCIICPLSNKLKGSVYLVPKESGIPACNG